MLVRTNGEGTAVIDEGPLARGPSRAPRRLTRSKHALDDALPVSPRRKRTRYCHAGRKPLQYKARMCMALVALLHKEYNLVNLRYRSLQNK